MKLLIEFLVDGFSVVCLSFAIVTIMGAMACFFIPPK